MDDAEILGQIDRGLLWLKRLTTRTPCVYHRERKLTVSMSVGRQGDRKRVQLFLNGRKRTILLHRLVWMYHALELIPEDCHVHHLDNNRHNCAITNLALLDKEAHYAIHMPQPF